MLDAFSDKNSSKFVGASFSLKLAFSLVLVPVTDMKVSDVKIQCLCDDRTGGDGSVRSCRLLIFAMTLEKDAGVDDVDLSDISAVNIVDENRQQEVEMLPSSRACIVIMVGSNAKVIIEVWFHLLNKFECIIFRDLWDFGASFTNLQNVLLVSREFIKRSRVFQ